MTESTLGLDETETKKLLEHAKDCKECAVLLPTNQVLHACEVAISILRRGKLTTPESPVAVVLRDELRRLLEQPLTVSSLRRIGRLVTASIKTIQATTGGVEGLLPTPRTGLGLSNYYGYPLSGADPDTVDLGTESVGSIPVMAPSPAIETFGTSSFREIAATALKFLTDKQEREDPEKFVHALAAAKAAALDQKLITKLEKALEKALGVPDEPELKTISPSSVVVSDSSIPCNPTICPLQHDSAGNHI